MYCCTSSKSVLEWKNNNNTKKRDIQYKKAFKIPLRLFLFFVFMHIRFYSLLNAMEKNNQKKKQPACLCFQAIFVCMETLYCHTKSKQPWLLVNVLHNSRLEVLWIVRLALQWVIPQCDSQLMPPGEGKRPTMLTLTWLGVQECRLTPQTERQTELSHRRCKYWAFSRRLRSEQWEALSLFVSVMGPIPYSITACAAGTFVNNSLCKRTLININRCLMWSNMHTHICLDTVIALAGMTHTHFDIYPFKPIMIKIMEEDMSAWGKQFEWQQKETRRLKIRCQLLWHGPREINVTISVQQQSLWPHPVLRENLDTWDRWFKCRCRTRVFSLEE